MNNAETKNSGVSMKGKHKEIKKGKEVKKEEKMPGKSKKAIKKGY